MYHTDCETNPCLDCNYLELELHIHSKNLLPDAETLNRIKELKDERWKRRLEKWYDISPPVALHMTKWVEFKVDIKTLTSWSAYSLKKENQ